MGLEYALVHLKYTIPPALLLSCLYRPFLTRIDLYKLGFLISIAVVSTIPWDSYLIRRKIWTYPDEVILGPTLYYIPAEEVFFFVIQTFNTTLLYLLLSKPILHSSYLIGRTVDGPVPLKGVRNFGQVFLIICIVSGAWMIRNDGEGTYLGLILAWAGPFALLLWSLSYQFLVNLPYTSTLVPIAVPTLYLWIVDTIALRRGTWAIESGTKLGIHLWDSLEIEEAIFFLATNVLIVFGLVAFDHAMAILLSFPSLFPVVPELPLPTLLVQALLTDTAQYDLARLEAVKNAAKRLQTKSRSFYMASSVFSGRLRIDLIFLYSFCRVADDLVDEADSNIEAQGWITKLTKYLDIAYQPEKAQSIAKQPQISTFIQKNFPKSSQPALDMLPTQLLSSGPLYELLEGFKTDLDFQNNQSSKELYRESRRFPIQDEQDLERYCSRVAGTVGELCLELVFKHSHAKFSMTQKEDLVRAGGCMGAALQLVNIARDISTDATMNRVYIPATWLKEEGLQPEDILKNPDGQVVEKLRTQLLNRAFRKYKSSRNAIEQLPTDARAPMRVAVESYMEIGRVLSQGGYQVKQGKATVPKLRRLEVAWNALKEG